MKHALNTPDSNGNPIRQVDGTIVPSANDVPLRQPVYQLLGLHSTTDGLQASADQVMRAFVRVHTSVCKCCTRPGRELQRASGRTMAALSGALKAGKTATS